MGQSPIKFNFNLSNIMSLIIKYSSFFGSSIFSIIFGILTLYVEIYTGLFYFTVLFFIYLITAIIRYFYYKPRPDNLSKKNYTLLQSLSESSFPSAHIQRVMLISYTLILLNIWFIFIGLVISLLVAYSRIFNKRHYWIDVFGGGVIVLILLVFLASVWKTIPTYTLPFAT